MAVKLASGYIELSVRKAGDAMKEITAEVTGLEETATKVGKRAGDALEKGMRDGVTRAGKSAGDALGKGTSAAAEKAGRDAGDAIERGVRKGSKKAGRAVEDELDNASKRAGGSMVDNIFDGIRKGAKDAGVDIDKEINDAAGRAGAKLGQKIHDAIAGSIAGPILGGVQDRIDSITDFTRGAADSIRNITGALHDRDIAGALTGISGALREIGQSDAATALDGISGKAGELGSRFFSAKSDIKDVAEGLATLTSGSGRMADGLGKMAGAAGPLAAAFTALSALPWADMNRQLHEIASIDPHVLTPIWNPIAGNGGFILPQMPGAGYQPPTITPNGSTVTHGPAIEPGWAPGTSPVPVLPGYGPVPNFDIFAPTDIPNHAGGGIAGVDSRGRLFGPGTPISDSILGIGPDGVPTALVSRGEGVVKNSAMERGMAPLVAAANGGWTPSTDMLRFLGLPGYDDGYPQPDPMMARWLAAMQSGRIGPGGQLLPGVGGEGGLQTNTIRAKRLLSALFPELGDIGGYRQDDKKWHPSGLALDLMIPGGSTRGGANPAGLALGEQINAFIKANAGLLGSDYTLWRTDEGGDHYNHMHANFAESGYPGKDQQFLLPPGLQAMLGGAAGQSGAGLSSLLGMSQAGSSNGLAPGAPGGGAGNRTQGYIPAGAGGGGQAGTSFVSGLLGMGADAINGLIDQAASAAATAASAAISAGSMGAGAAGGGQAGAAAAQFAIGLGTQAAKRGVDYGFQMAGIGIDALAEILSPFGVPRFFNTDVTQFMPQLPGQFAALTSAEKAALAQNDPAAAQQPGMQPGGPVQPKQLAGQSPVGAPVPRKAQPGGVPVQAPAAPSSLPGPSAGGIPGTPVELPPAGLPSAPPAAPAPQVPQVPTNIPQAPQSNFGLDVIFGPGSTYDDGGWLMPKQVGINMSNRPEPIFNAEQFANIQAIANQPAPRVDPAMAGASNDYSVRIENVTVSDVNAMQREIDSRQRLQMMRFGGRP